MPGQPVFKSKHVDQLVNDFALIATRFDKLLPAAFRYSGQVPNKGVRGNAWSIADRQMLLLGDALGSLKVALRLHAKKVVMGRAEPDAERDDAEANKVNLKVPSTVPMFADE